MWTAVTALRWSSDLPPQARARPVQTWWVAPDSISSCLRAVNSSCALLTSWSPMTTTVSAASTKASVCLALAARAFLRAMTSTASPTESARGATSSTGTGSTTNSSTRSLSRTCRRGEWLASTSDGNASDCGRGGIKAMDAGALRLQPLRLERRLDAGLQPGGDEGAVRLAAQLRHDGPHQRTGRGLP